MTSIISSKFAQSRCVGGRNNSKAAVEERCFVLGLVSVGICLLALLLLPFKRLGASSSFTVLIFFT